MRGLRSVGKPTLLFALLTLALTAEAQFRGPNVADIDRARAENDLLAAQARQAQMQNELAATQLRQAQLQNELLAQQLKTLQLQNARLEKPCSPDQ